MNILLINSKKEFAHSKGLLNETLQQVAKEALVAYGHHVDETIIDNGYNIEQEIEKYLKMDLVIYQMPAWWMGPPWILKKYFDDVFTAGHGKLYENDGRSRSDSSKKYGSGGLLQKKRYMLSVTWNAPIEAFNEADQFFEGEGVDKVYFPFHKANQFLGMQSVDTYFCGDVIKEPTIDYYIEQYKQHLKRVVS